MIRHGTQPKECPEDREYSNKLIIKHECNVIQTLVMQKHSKSTPQVYKTNFVKKNITKKYIKSLS